MAKDTKSTKRIEVVKLECVDVINLELDKEEAQLVADVLSKISGSPEKSRRGIGDKVIKALREAGYDWNRSPYGDNKGLNNGQIADMDYGTSLYFKDRGAC